MPPVAPAHRFVLHPEERSITVPGVRLSARFWQSNTAEPPVARVLALHGWLDNACSFDPMLECWNDRFARVPLTVCALDLAGHGQSEHRAAHAHYDNLSYLQDVLAVANELGWDHFYLLGHSMGGELASLCAGLFPARVVGALLIDGLAHAFAGSSELLDADVQAIEGALKRTTSRPRPYSSLDAMATRVAEATGQSIDSARLLVARGHEESVDGYRWRTDPRVRHSMPHQPYATQLNALFRRIQCEVTLIDAQGGTDWFAPGLPRARRSIQRFRECPLPGGHHLHMENQIAACTQELARLVDRSAS